MLRTITRLLCRGHTVFGGCQAFVHLLGIERCPKALYSPLTRSCDDGIRLHMREIPCASGRFGKEFAGFVVRQRTACVKHGVVPERIVKWVMHVMSMPVKDPAQLSNEPGGRYRSDRCARASAD